MTDTTTIIYTTDNDERLCKVTVPVPLNRITLADFKRKLPRSHAKKYSFIFEENEVSIGKTVSTHIDDDNQILPNVKGTVHARLIAKDSDDDGNTNENNSLKCGRQIQSNGKSRDARSTGSGGGVNGDHSVVVGSRRGGSEGTGSIINSFRGNQLLDPNTLNSSTSRHAGAYNQNATLSSTKHSAGTYTEDDDADTHNPDTCGEDGDESTNFFADTDDGSLSMATGITGSIANHYHNRMRRQMFGDTNIRSGYQDGEAKAAFRRFAGTAIAADRAYPPAPPASALLGASHITAADHSGIGREPTSLAYLVATGQLDAIEISFDLFHSGDELGLQLIDDNYNPHGMGGICISAVSPNEAVARDGRIEPGDVLLRINDTSIVDYGTAEEAVRVLSQAAEMSKQGRGPVRLTVVKHVAAWAQNSGALSKFERGGPVMPIDTRCWIQSQQEFDEMRARGELQPPLDAVTTVDSQPGNMHDLAHRQQFLRKSNNNASTPGGAMRMHDNDAVQAVTNMFPTAINTAQFAHEHAAASLNAAEGTLNACSRTFEPRDSATAQYCLTSNMDPCVIVRAMRNPVSGIKLSRHQWLKIWIPHAFTGGELIEWLRVNVKDLNERSWKPACKSYAKRLLAQGFIQDPFQTNSTAFSERRNYVFPGESNIFSQSIATDTNGMGTPTSLITTSTTLTSNKLSDSMSGGGQQHRTPNAVPHQYPSTAAAAALQHQQSSYGNMHDADADNDDIVDGLGTLRNDHHDHLRQVNYEDKAGDNITPDDSVSQVASSHDTYARRSILGAGLPPYPMPHHFQQQTRVRAGFAHQHQNVAGNNYSGSPALSAHYMRNSNGQPSYAEDGGAVRLSTLDTGADAGVQPSPKLLNYTNGQRQQQHPLLTAAGDVANYRSAAATSAKLFAGGGGSDGTASDGGHQQMTGMRLLHGSQQQHVRLY